MSIEIQWEPHGVYRKFRGLFTLADFQASRDDVFGNARFDELRYIINDCTEGWPGEAIDEAMVMMAAAIECGAARTNPRIRVAAVATDDKVLSLLKLYAEVPVSPRFPFQTFATLAEARAWVESER